jgi:hypothetical protein
MAPEIIACNENPEATYNNRVCFFPIKIFEKKLRICIE